MLLLAALFLGNEDGEYIATFGREYSEDVDRVEAFIKELYKNGVTFTELNGDGTVYKKRYYCSNVCIDLLNDGSIRYLSDENDADNEDKFLKWLYKDKVEIVAEEEFYGFLYRRVKSSMLKCEMCISRSDGRVVAARIFFNS